MKPLSTLVIAASLGALLAGGDRVDLGRPAPSRPPVFASRPLAFEANVGQTDVSVRFVARGSNASAFLTDNGAVLAAPTGALRIRPVGEAQPPAEGLDELPGKANYFHGNDPAGWHTSVPTFARVRQAQVQPGVDVVWHGCAGRLEYDFVVAPGADPSGIAVEFDGACSLVLDPQGDLRIGVGRDVVIQRRPVVYQEGAEGRQPIDGRYVVESGRRVSFAVGAYDPALPLVLDPVVDYATYLGGAGDDGARRIVRDAAGNLYVAGYTGSRDFPKVAAYDDTFNAPDGVNENEVFVAKLDPTGSTLLFSTYLGGGYDDGAYALAVSGTSVWVGGFTYSGDFPTTAGAFQTTQKSSVEGFISRLSLDGSTLIGSTYFAGSGPGDVASLAVDAAEDVYVTGQSTGGFAATAGVVQAASGGSVDAFACKLAPDLKSVLFFTYLGGSSPERGYGIALGPSGDVFVAGYTQSTTDFPRKNAAQDVYGGGSIDSFVTRLSADATQIIYSTYLGGTGYELVNDLAVDVATGEAVVVGQCEDGLVGVSNAFQTTFGGGTYDAFVARYAGDGTKLSLSYLGGGDDEIAYAAARDGTGRIFVAGSTRSTDFPVVDAEQPQRSGGTDAFVVRLDATASAAEYASYVGGNASDEAFGLAVSPAGVPWLAGISSSTDLPTTSGVPQPQHSAGNDGFIASSIGPQAPPPPPPPPPPIASFFLPKRVKAHANTKSPAKSTLFATGFIDTGPGAANFGQPATLVVGGFTFPIPSLVPHGASFTHTAAGIVFSITPSKAGSSRAQFKLTATGDLAGKIDLNGSLDLHFTQGAIDGLGKVTLKNGHFGLGTAPGRGALVEPNLYLLSTKATTKGGGKDTLSLVAGVATNGLTPPAAPLVTLGIGDSFAVTIPASAFTRKGDQYVSSGNFSGITKVVLDYARETISITGRRMTLGTFLPGANPVLVDIGVGADEHAVRVRMAHNGTALKY